MSDQTGIESSISTQNIGIPSSIEQAYSGKEERNAANEQTAYQDTNGNVPRQMHPDYDNDENKFITVPSPPSPTSGTQRPGSGRQGVGSGSKRHMSGTQRPVSDTHNSPSDVPQPTSKRFTSAPSDHRGFEKPSSEALDSDFSDAHQAAHVNGGGATEQRDGTPTKEEQAGKVQPDKYDYNVADGVSRQRSVEANDDSEEKPVNNEAANTEWSNIEDSGPTEKEATGAGTDPGPGSPRQKEPQETTVHPKKVKGTSSRPKSLTAEEAQNLMRNLMEKLLAIEVYDSNETRDVLKAIGRVYWNYKSKRGYVSEVLYAMDFAGLAVKYLVTFNKLGIFKSDSVWFPAYYTLNNIWNYTDASRQLAKDFADKGIVQLMIANITHAPYLENIASKNVVYVLKASLSILQNVSKAPETKMLFVENNAIEALKPFTTSENDLFKAVSMMTLTSMINESDNAVLEDTGVIPYMVSNIRLALAAKTRRYHGFSPTEMVECLARMAVNDSNKMKIVAEGALPHLVEMLGGSDLEEHTSAAQCLWTLSFDSEVRDLILKEPASMERLEQCAASENSATRAAARGALWKLREEEQLSQQQLENKEEEDTAAENHIMISYNWSHQKIILDIAAKLRGDGYRVWLDVDQMGGSTMSAMAEAVEKAAVVLVCMSEKYKLSPNCRTEGEYTFQLRKPIVPVLVQRKYRADGWLGILVGAKLYTDFSGKFQFDKAYGMLLKEINGRGHPDAPQPVVKQTAAVLNKAPPSQPQQSAELSSWSKEKVAQWLTENQLERSLEQFKEVDGRLMAALITLRTEAPDYFYNTMEKQFYMDIHSILQLINAMGSLP